MWSMYDEFTAFDYRRASAAVLILWLGGLVLEFEGTHILFLMAYRIGQGHDGLVLFLRSVFDIGSYAALAFFAAFWYFGFARAGFWQGAFLGTFCGIGWRIAHVVENGIRGAIGLPIMVRHFDPNAWLLLIGTFALTGVFMGITFPRTVSP